MRIQKKNGESYGYAGWHCGKPGEAIDCSGLVNDAVYHSDPEHTIGHLNTGDYTSGVTNIISNCRKSDLSELRKGDLVTFFEDESHIGIVTGGIVKDENGMVINFEFIHSGSSTGPVKASLSKTDVSNPKNNSDYWRKQLNNVYQWDTLDGGELPEVEVSGERITNNNSSQQPYFLESIYDTQLKF